MKYYLFILILAIFILAGCTKENSIVGPQSSQSSQTLPKGQWIVIGLDSSLSIENTYTVSKSIDGKKGGSIELAQTFQDDGNQASFSAILTIPPKAFKGTEVISYTVNTETASIEFSPNTKNFKKNLSLDLTFIGLDISKYRASDLSFSYLDGNKIVPVKSDYVRVDIQQGILEVLGAEIRHFSRFGWSTKDGTQE